MACCSHLPQSETSCGLFVWDRPWWVNPSNFRFAAAIYWHQNKAIYCIPSWAAALLDHWVYRQGYTSSILLDLMLILLQATKTNTTYVWTVVCDFKIEQFPLLLSLRGMWFQFSFAFTQKINLRHDPQVWFCMVYTNLANCNYCRACWSNWSLMGNS